MRAPLGLLRGCPGRRSSGDLRPTTAGRGLPSSARCRPSSCCLLEVPASARGASKACRRRLPAGSSEPAVRDSSSSPGSAAAQRETGLPSLRRRGPCPAGRRASRARGSLPGRRANLDLYRKHRPRLRCDEPCAQRPVHVLGCLSPPASTGIRGGPYPPDRGCGLDLRAVTGARRVRPLRAPTMNEAPTYGCASLEERGWTSRTDPFSTSRAPQVSTPRDVSSIQGTSRVR